MTVDNVNKVVRLTALALFVQTVVVTTVLAALGLPTPPPEVLYALVALLGAGELGSVGKRYTWKREATIPPHEGPTP